MFNTHVAWQAAPRRHRNHAGRNLADYARTHGLRWRPHIKTHRTIAWALRQIELGAGPDYRTYQVQLTREGSITESKGFVVTLDDITDLVSAQRNSAWADIARRISP